MAESEIIFEFITECGDVFNLALECGSLLPLCNVSKNTQQGMPHVTARATPLLCFVDK
jgi:hypothetical protein